MVTIIQGDTGLTLFSKTFEHFCLELEDDVDLVGCFITAMDSFTMKLKQKGLKFIEMSDLDVILYKKPPLTVIFCVDKNENIEDYKRKISITANSFIKTYKIKLQQSTTDTIIFQDFNKQLQEILELPPEEITMACPNCDFDKNCECIYYHTKQKLEEKN